MDASPDLADLVHLPLHGETQPLDTRPLSSRVTTVLRTMGDDWRASWRAQFDLDPLVAVAQERLTAGALDDARRAFRAIIDAILACYVEVRDEESEIANIVRDCVSGLGRVLHATTMPAERAQVLRDLFDVFAWDRILHGGYGMSEPVEELLVHHTTDDEKAQVLAWIYAARPAGDTQRSRWGRQAAGGLCLALMGDDAEPDAVATVLQWAGLTRRYLQQLLAAGRRDDAVLALASASEDLTGCADAWLDGLESEEVLPGLRYLRNGHHAELHGGIVVAGLGGCHGPSNYERPANTLQGSARRHYTRDELDRLAASPRPDVLLLHDAPAGIEFVKRFPSGDERRYRSEAAGLGELVARLRPAVCFFGHHHHRVDAEVGGVRCVGLNAVGRPGHLVAFALEAGGQPGFLGEWPRSTGRTT